jgi:hypothetical protein
VSARSSPETAWRNFRELAEQQLCGRVVEERWLGANAPHRIICWRGHEASVCPSNAKRAGRICAACSRADRDDSVAAWQKFREQVEARGGHVIEPRWLGVHRRHRVICAAGHAAAPVPVIVNRAGGICRTCSGNDPEASERAFRFRLAEAGAELLEPYVNSVTPVLVRCAQGHQTKRTSDSVRDGKGCRICSGTDQQAAWRQFCEIVAQRGGRVLEPEPLGNGKLHRVLCPQGHETAAIPWRVKIGGGMCSECSPTSTSRPEREFRRLVAAAGARIAEPSWLGSTKPHRVVCRYSHETTPRPNDVLQGHGLCRICAYRIWDVFYVVMNESSQTVKFGITSNDPRRRLTSHRADGFSTILKTITSLPDAADLERAALAALRLAGIPPVRGREYFDITALPVVLDIADNWPAANGAAVA